MAVLVHIHLITSDLNLTVVTLLMSSSKIKGVKRVLEHWELTIHGF